MIAGNTQLVKAVICAGLYPKVAKLKTLKHSSKSRYKTCSKNITAKMFCFIPVSGDTGMLLIFNSYYNNGHATVTNMTPLAQPALMWRIHLHYNMDNFANNNKPIIISSVV